MESTDVIRVLEDDRWTLVIEDLIDKLRIYKHPKKQGQIMVPHPMTLPFGTAQSILRAAGLS